MENLLSIDLKREKSFLSNSFMDLFFIHSAFWIFPLFFIIAKMDIGYLRFGAAFVFIIIRIVHTYLSMYLCIGHPMYRPIAMKQKWRFFGLPGLIIGGITLFFIIPDSILPWDTRTRFQFYSFAVFPMTYWHYAAQHYGVLSIYRSRVGQKLSNRDVWMEKFFCQFSTGFLITMLTLKNLYDVEFFGVSFKEMLLIDSVNWNEATGLVLIPLTIYMIIKEFQHEKPSILKLLYMVSMAMMVSVITVDSLLISWVLIDMQHFMVVMALGGHMLSKSDARPNFYKKFGFLVLISFAMSLVYYYFDAHGVRNKHYQTVLYWMPTHGEDFLQLFFYGLFIAIGICHYYYDRLAFRFSDKDIREVAKKLI